MTIESAAATILVLGLWAIALVRAARRNGSA